MSKYTTEVRFVCESMAGRTESAGYNSIDEIVTTAAPLIFNFEFPIYDESYRLPLEKRILKHYYTREICEETVGLWQLRLEDKLNLIMPYYNKLYQSALLNFNPLYDVDYTDEHTRKNDDVRNTNSIRNEDRDRTVNESEDVTGNLNRNETSNSNRNEKRENEQIATKQYNDDETKNSNKNGTTENEREQDVNENRNESTTQNKNNNDWDLFSDTPQSGINGVDSQSYLTTARNQYGTENNVTGTETSVGNLTSENQNTKSNETENTVVGKSGDSNSTQNDNTTINATDNRVNGINESSANNTDRETNENENSKISSTENSVIGGLEEYAQHVFGKRGGMTYSKMLLEFRETFLKIDMMLINDLSDLFFGLW